MHDNQYTALGRLIRSGYSTEADKQAFEAETSRRQKEAEEARAAAEDARKRKIEEESKLQNERFPPLPVEETADNDEGKTWELFATAGSGSETVSLLRRGSGWCWSFGGQSGKHTVHANHLLNLLECVANLNAVRKKIFHAA